MIDPNTPASVRVRAACRIFFGEFEHSRRDWDLSGLVPHTEDWLANWKQRIERLLGGQGQGDAGRIPLEAIDALVAAGAAREELPGG